MKKLSDFVVECIVNAGVKDIFLLPGGGCMHLIDSVGRNRNINYIVNLHEQACAIAAEAYGQYTNNLGVALVTTGPGATNAITGTAAAWLDSTPCLFISGQVKRADMIGNRGVRQMGFQEINIVDMVKPITKYAVTVTNPEDIQYHIEKALHLAKTGRPGPVWLDIPLDVQSAMVDETSMQHFSNDENATGTDETMLAHQVVAAVELIKNAERPVLLVGNGVRLSDAIDELYRLVDVLQIPVLTTWKALDLFDENDEAYIGRPGAVGQRGANFAQQNSDLILIIGARLDLGQTGYNHRNFAPAAKKIMVDIDEHEIQKMDTTIDVSVTADARVFIKKMLQHITSEQCKNISIWKHQCCEWKKKYPVILPEYWEQKEYVNDYVLLQVLSEEMTAEDVLIPGSSGACSERTMQAFPEKKGIRVLNSEGLGPMGFGLPAAIGGCIASGKRRTICIDGDGGFVMNIQELETVKRLNLPIKIFILNNQGYVSIRTTQNGYFNGNLVGSSVESGLTLPNFLKVALSYGIETFRIENHSDLREKVRCALEYQGPVLCEVMVDPDFVTAPKMTSMQLPDGTFVSKPLEDLWPFLERDEFNANMLTLKNL